MAFFLAMLALSYGGLIMHVQRTSRIWSTIGERLGARGSAPMGDPPGLWYAVKDRNGPWRAELDRSFRGGPVATAIAQDPSSVVLLDWRTLEGSTGFYDPAVYVTGRELSLIRADATPLAAEEIPRLFRDLASTDARVFVDPRYDVAPWEISAGRATQRRTEIYGPAVANNVIASVGLIGFLWSLGWIPASLARRRRRARLSRDLCPWCAYDRAEATAGPCPECGSAFEPDRKES